MAISPDNGCQARTHIIYREKCLLMKKRETGMFSFAGKKINRCIIPRSKTDLDALGKGGKIGRSTIMEVKRETMSFAI